ncbi:hypothetical protein [uncultured Sphingomonas sp.]|uniref:hypothetical protein n=1 Tax=uncultured Sphingomonas sp. TaxID=158754 RepID=UPI0025D32B21|nr:hypothetical protein [uncultured Sphingomonas sp.]
MLAIRADLDPIYALPLAIATGAVVIWTCLALDALIRRRAPPDRADIANVRDFQHENRATMHDQAHRLDRLETIVTFLAAQPALDAAEREQARAAAAVEQWDSLSETLPIWYEARRIWAELAERFVPGCISDADMPTPDQLSNARHRLPITKNFSSGDMKAATHYLVRADQTHQALRSLRWYGSSLNKDQLWSKPDRHFEG